MLAIVTSLGVAFVGCDSAEILEHFEEAASSSGQYVSTPVSNYELLPERSANSILVASFNIQVFGKSKMENTWVMQHLAQVARQFDIVAIQEIREKDQLLMPAYLDYINRDGANYDFIIGARLGQTVSQEQYAYVYDKNRILADKDAAYTLRDGAPESGTQTIGDRNLDDLLHREPLVARFVVNLPDEYRPFRFTLMNIHTDPDVVDQELNVLGPAYINVRNYEYQVARQEDDVILLGDLNAGPGNLGALERIPDLVPLIHSPTNSRRSKIYDNILIDQQLTAEFTGRAGVLDLEAFFDIPFADANRLSDHYPVWAEFTAQEVDNQFRSQMASGPSTVRR